MTAQSSPTLIIDEAPSVVASVERIDAWLSIARKGDRFVYATREHLPPRSTGAMRMRTLAERRFVCLVQPRAIAGGSLFNFTAIRTDVPLPGAKPFGRPTLAVVAAPLVDGEAAIVDALLPVLERFARHRRPCPTDKQLAVKAQLSEEQVKAGLEAMVAGHLIRVQGCAAPTYRRIVIVASGSITGIAA